MPETSTITCPECGLEIQQSSREVSAVTRRMSIEMWDRLCRHKDELQKDPLHRTFDDLFSCPALKRAWAHGDAVGR